MYLIESFERGSFEKDGQSFLRNLRRDDQEILSELFQEINNLGQKLSDRIDRRMQGPVSPNSETTFKLKKFGNTELIALAILSWGMTDSARTLLQLELWERKVVPFQQQELLWALLSSRSTCSEYLTVLVEKRVLYGTLLPLMKKMVNDLQLYKVSPSKARRLVRRRGYRDHGTLRRSDQWLPDSDYSLTEIQNDWESLRDFQENCLTAIKQNGLLGVRLSRFE